jgi:hypothetical protein
VQIRKDPDIATELDECQIEELQISGVWLFGSSSNKIEGVKNSMFENFIQFE